MNELEFLELKRQNYQKYGSVYRPEGGIVPRFDAEAWIGLLNRKFALRGNGWSI